MIVISAQAFPPRTGGIQNLLAGCAEYMAEVGHDVVVLADGDKAARNADVLAGKPYRIERFGGPKPWRRKRKYRRIRELARTQAIKALYADTWKSIELFDKSFDFPVIAWAHGNEFPPAGSKFARIKLAMSKANYVIFNSNDTQKRAAAFTPENTPSCIIHPPIFNPTQETSAQRAQIDDLWEDSELRLVSICRLIDWKGLDQVIRALPLILNHYPRCRYVIAGIGDDRSRLEALIRDLKLEDQVTFLGRIGEGVKTALFKTADIFMQPGRQVIEEREGYGITYREAALHGLPSVCGRAGGAPEAVIDGATGLVIDALDHQSVADAVFSIFADKTRYQKMRAAARKHGESALWCNQVTHVLDVAGLTSHLKANG